MNDEKFVLLDLFQARIFPGESALIFDYSVVQVALHQTISIGKYANFGYHNCHFPPLVTIFENLQRMILVQNKFYLSKKLYLVENL